MRIAIVNEGLGYPANAGNRIRTLNLLLPLARRHEITYICRGVADPAERDAAASFYAAHGIRTIITADHGVRKTGFGFYGQLLGNMLSPLPFSIASHDSPLVRQAVARLAATEHIDVWQVETLSYADVLRGRDARTVIMAHNVESLIWERLHQTERHALKRAYIGHQWQKYERFEAYALAQATRVVAVTEEDAALFVRRFGIARPDVVDNGVDLAYFETVAHTRVPGADRILFLGSLDWRPNLDSVDLLVKEILPAVRRRLPHATLDIVGRNPSPSLVRLARSADGVTLHPDVPDVRPFLARATVMAVPLRIGGGSRLKILEAAAAGVPVVSTRIGSEGLAFADGRDIVIVEDVTDMANALIQALLDPERMAMLARNALGVARARYGWNGLAARLESIWELAAATQSRHVTRQA